MEDKLVFLKKYHKNVKFVELDKINYELIPKEWEKVFVENEPRKRINCILNLWKKHCGDELRNTISYLCENVVDVNLIEYDGKYSILYEVKTSEGEIEYYEGGNPKEKFNNFKLESVWSEFPDSVRKFYEQVHNGFYFYASQSMGLVPIQCIIFFDDDEWSIIDELEEPLKIDLKKTFGFFKSGMGGYVAIDYSNCNNNNATLWFSNSQPRYNVDFWDIVDEWIVIGFE